MEFAPPAPTSGNERVPKMSLCHTCWLIYTRRRCFPSRRKALFCGGEDGADSCQLCALHGRPCSRTNPTRLQRDDALSRRLRDALLPHDSALEVDAVDDPGVGSYDSRGVGPGEEEHEGVGEREEDGEHENYGGLEDDDGEI